MWALTWPLAEFGACSRFFQWCWGEGHSCGGWIEGLWRKGRGEQRLLSLEFSSPNSCNCLSTFIVFRVFHNYGLPHDPQINIDFLPKKPVRLRKEFKVQRNQNNSQPVKYWGLASTLAHLGFLLSFVCTMVPIVCVVARS